MFTLFTFEYPPTSHKGLSSLQLPTLAPTISAALSNSIELASATGTTNSKYTSPSPSLSDSYARTHPGEVEIMEVPQMDIAVGPSLSVSEVSPSSPQMLGNAHIFGLSPNLHVPPRLVVVNPTPNLTPHPTPPASPVSVFTSASSAWDSTSHNNHHGFWDTKGSRLTLPPNRYPNRIQDPQTYTDRSRSDSVPTDINFVSSSSFSLPQSSQPPTHRQSVDEDQLLTSQSFVQDLEISANSNSNRHSISSTTTIASVTDSAISTATAATSVFLDEASPVVGSPVNDVDVQPMSKAEGSCPFMTLRLDSLSTIHSMSVGKGGDGDEVSADDLEELDGETQLMDTTTTTAAAATKKTKIRKKVKTKTKLLKRNSLKSTTSTLSASLHQSTSSAPPSNRSSGSQSMSHIGRSSFDVGVGANRRGRERMIAMEIIQMQRRQQLLIQQQQQQQLEMKQREDEQRSLIAQLARQDADVHEAEIRKHRQRLHHEQRQEQGMQREENGLLDVSSKRPVMFNVEHSNPDPNTNTKHSTHETLNMVSSALAAKVKQTLADPLLPGQHKRMVVLTTSDSEFEHSEDDDGSWSSEEMGSEDEEEGRRQERQRQGRLLAQQQQQQLQKRPSPVQRNHPIAANHNHNHNRIHAANTTQRTQSSRGHRHPPNHAQGQALTQAAQEAQRQRDMFAKKPTESFQNLLQVARTQSVGLLTQLLNPDPEIFPVGHPYRRGYSSSEMRGVGGRASASRGDRDKDRSFRPLQPLMDVKAEDNKLDTHPPPSSPEVTVHYRLSTAALSPPARALSMQRIKSAVAMPVSSQVQTGSHTSHAVEGLGGGYGAVDGLGITHMKMTVNSNHSSGGYRPKGRPLDQELEDESGSEAECGIQVSKSVALEKLKALAERRGIFAHGNQSTTTTNDGGANINQKNHLGDEDDVLHWAKFSKPRPSTRTRSHDQYPQSQAPDPNVNYLSVNTFHFGQITSTPSHPAPIPINHPYNLPPPLPPSTPRTTRRLMLSTELSESFRRNLLWERQMCKVAVRKTASSGGSRLSPFGGVQPFMTVPSMVQLLPKGTMAHPNPGSPVRTVGPERPEQVGSEGDDDVKKERTSGGAGDHPGPSVHDEKEKEQNRWLAMARNRSWANDFHFAGW